MTVDLQLGAISSFFVKRFLTTLLAALTLPTTVYAEIYWLVLRVDDDSGIALEKIEMKSMEQCEEQGEDWSSSFGIGRSDSYYKCFIGE